MQVIRGSIPGLGRSHMPGNKQAHGPQLLGSRGRKPQLLKPVHPRARAPQQEKPPQEASTPQPESTPTHHHRRKAHTAVNHSQK